MVDAQSSSPSLIIEHLLFAVLLFQYNAENDSLWLFSYTFISCVRVMELIACVLWLPFLYIFSLAHHLLAPHHLLSFLFSSLF